MIDLELNKRRRQFKRGAPIRLRPLIQNVRLRVDQLSTQTSAYLEKNMKTIVITAFACLYLGGLLFVLSSKFIAKKLAPCPPTHVPMGHPTMGINDYPATLDEMILRCQAIKKGDLR